MRDFFVPKPTTLMTKEEPLSANSTALLDLVMDQRKSEETSDKRRRNRSMWSLFLHAIGTLCAIYGLMVIGAAGDTPDLPIQDALELVFGGFWAVFTGALLIMLGEKL